MTVQALPPPVEYLRVYPNPWHTFDHEGQPCGTVPFDPVHGGGARRWVGARLASSALENKPKALMVRRRREGGTDTLYSEEAIHRFLWAFELEEPTLLPVLPCYVGALRTGELIAADEATAALAHCAYQPRAEALAAAKAAGLAAYVQAHGRPPAEERWPDALRLLAAPPAGASL